MKRKMQIRFGNVIIHLASGSREISCVYENTWKPFSATVVMSGIGIPKERPKLRENDSVKLKMFGRETIALVKHASRGVYEAGVHVWSISLSINAADFPFTETEFEAFKWEPLRML